MKKTRRSSNATSEMRPEYEFDYREAKPNRFASRMQTNAVAVLLEPDVAQVFDSSASVNRLLRSVITALPKKRKSGDKKIRRKAS